MQDIIIEKPYEFVPPHRGNWWPSFIQKFDLISIWLRRSAGVVSHECRDVSLLQESISAGHGVMLAPNHCRAADPIVMGYLARQAHTHVFAMASWHLYHQGRFMAWALPKMGAFSVNREGLDRTAINTAIDMLTEAKRPLIVFPEGAVSRTNDRLHAMLDGVSFIARVAAKKRQKNGGKVVVHPVAIKYLFGGDLEATIDPILSTIEYRFSWRPQRHMPLIDRVHKVGRALLCLKEMEFFGAPQGGSPQQRREGLINRLLDPLEEEWLGGVIGGSVVPRVKTLRMKMLPDMVLGNLSPEERNRRWEQLADIYLAQQISCYLPDYISSLPSVDRILETVERFEEDLTDIATVHGSLKVVLQVGQAIEVTPNRSRDKSPDPLMAQLETDLQAMLDQLASESPLYQPSK